MEICYKGYGPQNNQGKNQFWGELGEIRDLWSAPDALVEDSLHSDFQSSERGGWRNHLSYEVSCRGAAGPTLKEVMLPRALHRIFIIIIIILGSWDQSCNRVVQHILPRLRFDHF